MRLSKPPRPVRLDEDPGRHRYYGTQNDRFLKQLLNEYRTMRYEVDVVVSAGVLRAWARSGHGWPTQRLQGTGSPINWPRNCKDVLPLTAGLPAKFTFLFFELLCPFSGTWWSEPKAQPEHAPVGQRHLWIASLVCWGNCYESGNGGIHVL